MSSSPPPEEKQSRKDQILAQATEKLEKAQQEAEAANEARQRSDAVEDAEEKNKILAEASEHDHKAKALSRDAQRLQSGIWQGGLGGAGIGATVGAGLGAGLGTVVTGVVGGVAVIPTTAVGLLVGVGAGAIHGPWYKLGGNKEEEEAEKAQPQAAGGDKDHE
ncbi:hypothetical protein CcaCcLH18_09984 [Colletotrichum camelliae]|nr:hypothetical protein CcaCcLH18_09984 [Colletotrichum camelliae]